MVRQALLISLVTMCLPSRGIAQSDLLDFTVLRQSGLCSVKIEAQGQRPPVKVLLVRSRNRAAEKADKIERYLSALRVVQSLAEPLEFAGDVPLPDTPKLSARRPQPVTLETTDEAPDGGTWHYQLFSPKSSTTTGILKAEDLKPVSVARSIFVKDCGGITGAVPALPQPSVVQTAAQILGSEDKNDSPRIWFVPPDPASPCTVDAFYISSPPKGAADPRVVKSGRVIKFHGRSPYGPDENDYEPISVYDYKDLDDYPALRALIDKRFGLTSNLPFPKGVLAVYKLSTTVPKGGWQFSAIEKIDVRGLPTRNEFIGAPSKSYLVYRCSGGN